MNPVLKRLIAFVLAIPLAAAPTAAGGFVRAAERETPYPSEISVSGDGSELREIYVLSDGESPDDIPWDDMTLFGRRYVFWEMIRRSETETQTRPFTKAVSFESATDDAGAILALVPESVEAAEPDGFSGTLAPDFASLKVVSDKGSGRFVVSVDFKGEISKTLSGGETYEVIYEAKTAPGARIVAPASRVPAFALALVLPASAFALFLLLRVVRRRVPPKASRRGFPFGKSRADMPSPFAPGAGFAAEPEEEPTPAEEEAPEPPVSRPFAGRAFAFAKVRNPSDDFRRPNTNDAPEDPEVCDPEANEPSPAESAEDAPREPATDGDPKSGDSETDDAPEPEDPDSEPPAGPDIPSPITDDEPRDTGLPKAEFPGIDDAGED